MKRRLTKVKMQNAKHENSKCADVFILQILLFTYPSIFLAGCNGTLPSQNTIDQPDSVPISNLVFQAFQIIQEGLADADPQVRANTIEVVAATKQIRLMPKIHRLLNDEAVPVKFSAILAVGDLQYSLAEREVQLFLKDENENIRIAAAYAITRLGHAQYFDVFRNAVTSEDQTVRANAALLMGKSGHENALKLLYWVLQRKDSSDMVRFNAVEAIAMLGDERIFPKLWAIVYSAYADDRIIGIRAMGALGTSKAKEVLITKLDDDVLEVRLAAAEQLGKLKDPIGEPEVLNVFTKDLTANLDKKDLERIKKLTALAIGQIGTNNLQRFLPQLLMDESKFVRIAAAKAVFQCAMRK